jgi:hypothetical protein
LYSVAVLAYGALRGCLMSQIEIELAKRAFQAGFSAAVEIDGRRRRHKVDPITHQHWRRGFEAGAAALRAAAVTYGRELAAAVAQVVAP